jgi:A/G-specific adenine glycosylase
MAYYDRLLKRFPSIYHLAEAEEQEVLKVWEGLGYYSRARNLHSTAKKIVNEYKGVFPNDYDTILSLKGIGPYTASAIASIAFSKVHPAIDGNVMRVASRVFCIELPVNVQSTYKIILEKLLLIIDPSHPGDFNQAMMELGALICTPQQPKCNICPLSSHCEAFDLGVQHELPIKKKKNKAKEMHYNYYLFYSDDEILIEKREKGIWINLYQFPLLESEKIIESKEQQKLLDKFGINENSLIIESDIFKHILSHIVIFARFYMVKLDRIDTFKSYLKIKKDELEDFPMPRIIHRFLNSKKAKQNLLM